MTERRQNGVSRPRVPVNPNDGMHEIMALAGQSWGRGADATEARKRLREHTSARVRAYLVVPKGAWIDDMGRLIEWSTENGNHVEGLCDLCNTKTS